MSGLSKKEAIIELLLLKNKNNTLKLKILEAETKSEFYRQDNKFYRNLITKAPTDIKKKAEIHEEIKKRRQHEPSPIPSFNMTAKAVNNKIEISKLFENNLIDYTKIKEGNFFNFNVSDDPETNVKQFENFIKSQIDKKAKQVKVLEGGSQTYEFLMFIFREFYFPRDLLNTLDLAAQKAKAVDSKNIDFPIDLKSLII
jgi:hypothetical protein